MVLRCFEALGFEQCTTSCLAPASRIIRSGLHHSGIPFSKLLLEPPKPPRVDLPNLPSFIGEVTFGRLNPTKIDLKSPCAEINEGPSNSLHFQACQLSPPKMISRTLCSAKGVLDLVNVAESCWICLLSASWFRGCLKFLPRLGSNKNVALQVCSSWSSKTLYHLRRRSCRASRPEHPTDAHCKLFCRIHLRRMNWLISVAQTGITWFLTPKYLGK